MGLISPLKAEAQVSSISVVIATLGGPLLKETLDSLNAGSVVPNEIIISIPEKEASSVSHLQSGNVFVHVSKDKGQVAQRCEGFKKAKGEFVLQVDDDILIEENTLELLVKNMLDLPSKSACAPALYFKGSGLPVYNKVRIRNRLQNLYYAVLNGKRGYREGCITLAGTEIGVNPLLKNEQPIKCEWLPGGIALHRKENVVTDNYFPFSGKAFSEDLFHSLALRGQGCDLFILPFIKAYIDDPRDDDKLTFNQKVKIARRDLKIRRELLIRLQGNPVRMYAYYFFRILSDLKNHMLGVFFR